jgi:hypothetical protein
MYKKNKTFYFSSLLGDFLSGGFCPVPSITNIAQGGSANQIAVFTSN